MADGTDRAPALGARPTRELLLTGARERAAKARLFGLNRALVLRNRTRRAAWTVLGRRPRSVSSEDLLTPAIRDHWPLVQSAAGFKPLPGVDTFYAVRLRGDLVMEPQHGWVIAPPRTLVPESLPYSDWAGHHPMVFPTPSFSRYALRRPPASRRIPAAISLRTAWEENYFHFLNDILGRLRLIDLLGIDPAIPFVVSALVFQRPYFQHALATGVFGGREVIEQRSGEIIAFDELILCKKPGGYREDLDYFVDRLVPATAPDRTRKVFLVRSAVRGRTLSNANAAAELAARFGYEPVDPDQLTPAEQIATFASVSHVVGVHSAGLANMLFARGSAKSLIEILPPGWMPIGWNAIRTPQTDFGFFADAFGFAYQALEGTPEGFRYDAKQNFRVDLDALAAALKAAEEAPGSRR